MNHQSKEVAMTWRGLRVALLTLFCALCVFATIVLVQS